MHIESSHPPVAAIGSEARGGRSRFDGESVTRSRSQSQSDEMLVVDLEDLRAQGAPEMVVDEIRSMGTVRPSATGEEVVIDVASVLAVFSFALAVGIIEHWVFTTLLDIIGIAPWQ